MSLQTYKASINVFPGQQMSHTFPKSGMTAAEVQLIRFIHGDESVKDLKADKADANFDIKDERDRLNVIYGQSKVVELFGRVGNLPRELEEVDVLEDKGYSSEPVQKTLSVKK